MSFCLQVYTSKFPIYQSFQSCDPKESSCQAGNEYKHSSHWSVCGPPRCKQITQPEQTYKVPVPDPNRDRVKYYLAHLPDFEMSLMLERCSVYISFTEEESHHYAWHSHGCPGQGAMWKRPCATVCSKPGNGVILKKKKSLI